MRELRRRRATIIGVLALSMAASAMWASSASAVIVTLANGKTLSYQPLPSSAPKPFAPKPFDRAFTNLDYNGGPVMPSNTNYAIYWSPPGLSAYGPDCAPGICQYFTGINQYFTDLAHDSGGHRNVDSVSTQYNDASGKFANYKSSFGGALVDTHPYPKSQCNFSKSVTPCVTDAQIQFELGRFIAASGLPRDLTHEYFLFKPPGVEDCFDANPADGCSAGYGTTLGYCAYHGNSTTVPTFIYADDPYVTGIAGCDDGNHPNGTTSDGAIQGGLSHEHNESITDPIPNTAWTDFGSRVVGENGDKCAQITGSPLGTAPNGSPFNQEINGHLYWYQEEWSNQINQGNHCLQRLTFSGAEPTAQFTSTAVPGGAMAFNATGSTAPGGVAQYNFQYNDPPGLNFPIEQTTPSFTHTFASAGTYTVALTVFAPDGTSIGNSRVIRTGHNGPTATFSVSANPAAGRPTSFDGGSSGPLGTISSYSWNFGDGSLPGTGAATSHAYATGGSYYVTLEVTDVLGQTASSSRPVTIGAAGGAATDELPTAAFSVTPKHPGYGQQTSFNGTRSSDPDGSIGSYRWSFGDRSAAVSGAAPRHKYRHPGTYTVRLTVTDSSGLSASTTESVKAAFADRITRIGTAVDRQGKFVLIKVNGPGTLTIGRKRFHLHRARTVRFKVRFSGAQLQRVQGAHVLRIKLEFVPSAGLTYSKTKTLKFRF